jgi:hypothetical protein
MNERACRQMVVLALVTVLGIAVTASVGWAGSKIFDPLSSCTTLNCSASVLNGTYTHDQFSNADPFVIQVFTTGNDCLRIEGISQGTDLEATLTLPNGTTFRNDDKGFGCGLCPLLKVRNTTGNRGWATLTISHFAGEGVNADFTLLHGRYTNPLGNPNCATPTIGFGPSGAAPEKPDSGEQVGPSGGTTQ